MAVLRMPVTPIDRAPLERGDHVEVADRLVAKLRAESPVSFVDGRFYRYQGPTGIFDVADAAKLSCIVQGFAGAKIKSGEKAKPLRMKAADVHGVIRLASDQLSDPYFFAGAQRGIGFSNGFVKVSADRITQCEHSPEHRARFAYDFDFITGPQPTRLLRFFDEVFLGDADGDEKVALIQEYLGASLLGFATQFQRALAQIGDGANGKGVVSSIAEGCMPPGSVCSIPPQDVGNEYRRALLAGKLLNIVSELPEADILDSESWKSVVAGDTMTAREIRQAPFIFRPLAGHVYSANRLPGTTDQTHGFWRRLIVVEFNRIFAEHEQNPRLAEEILTQERRAIVCWILAGAQRALAQGGFTVPSSSTAAKDRWRAQADQVRAFVDAWTTPLPLDEPIHMWTPAEQLYRSYRVWAGENGHRSVASNTFGERMRLLGLGSKSDGRARRHPVRLERSDEHGA